ncbi:hypothetical protein ABT234_15075 [Streptomyces sp. NPDC001586]|uniref:hypothetical protein n=1 Tax=Streptomyces sp. NPDC001586 TaxID=3154387 RepID=UPI00331BB6E4
MDVPLAGLLGAFAVTGGLAWLAAGRRRGPVGITAAVLSVQGVLHLLFSGSQTAGHGAMEGHHHVPAGEAGGAMAAGGPGAAHMASTADMAGMPDAAGMADVHGMAGTADMAGIADMVGMADMAAHGGFGMIAAHLLAGLLCAAWLARGEAAVFRLARALGAAALHAARPLARALALVRARVAAVPAPPVFPAPYERPRGLRGAVHAHAVVRRGPPRPGPFPRFTAPGRPARA